MHPFPGMNVTLLECAYKMIGNSPTNQKVQMPGERRR